MKEMTMGKMMACMAQTVLLAAAVHAGDYSITMPRVGSVRPTDGFWAQRDETNRRVTGPANVRNSETTGRIENFVNAGKALRGEPHGKFRGAFFNDSDVYKAAEGLAYSLAMRPDAKIEKTLEDLVAKFASAQEPDGYLYTPRTLGSRQKRVGDRRWYCDDAHELYCMGHMIEAAVAHFEATGRRDFLEVACRSGDMIRRTFGFGKGQIRFLPGHEEIEIALCKLYRATGKRDYLEAALDLLAMRGLPDAQREGCRVRGFPKNRAYYQDHLPVREQREAVGHSVRACYLYTAMVEAGVLAGDAALLSAADALWEDVTFRKMHLTGGVGTDRGIEGFGGAYDLPNDRCYLETCAAIAFALFNERQFLRTGEAKYMDLVERIAYNGMLASTAITGDAFFYPNPLASRGGYQRSKWFGCACCPPNVVRFIPQLVTWTYAENAAKNAYYWNLFAGVSADLGRVRFEQRTDYPWRGDAVLAVTPRTDGDRFTVKVRIPGWARGTPVPGTLYAQVVPSRLEDVRCEVNGKTVSVTCGADGYLDLDRAWAKGDTVKVSFDMTPRRIRADERVEADRGRFAVERGPLVYCAEGADNGGKAFTAVLPPDAPLAAGEVEICGQRMVSLVGGGLTLVPYFAWCHRGADEMQVWFAKDRKTASGNESGVLVTASHCFKGDTVDALFDGKLPKDSADESIPRLTFWNHRGTAEWFSFEPPSRIQPKRVSVYWFDDAHVGRGQCALPEKWTVQVRDFPGLPWHDVEGATYTTVMDGFSVAEFPAPVDSDSFRVNVKCRDGKSAGALEVRYE